MKSKWKLNRKQKEKLKKFPFLKKYVDDFLKEDKVVNSCRFCDLIVWIRYMVDDNDIAIENVFPLEEHDIEEFYSWGPNSRWLYVFLPYAMLNRSTIVDVCISLAEEYGEKRLKRDLTVQSKPKKIEFFECKHFEYEYDGYEKYCWCHNPNSGKKECDVKYKYCHQYCPFYEKSNIQHTLDIVDCDLIAIKEAKKKLSEYKENKKTDCNVIEKRLYYGICGHDISFSDCYFIVCVDIQIKDKMYCCVLDKVFNMRQDALVRAKDKLMEIVNIATDEVISANDIKDVRDMNYDIKGYKYVNNEFKVYAKILQSSFYDTSNFKNV